MVKGCFIHSFCALALMLFAPAALALNNRSAVSIDGLDTNPCTTTSPCRSFSAAVTNTEAGGEIIAMTSAGYGPFFVDKQLTVSGAPGVHAAITATSGTAIEISNGIDRVVLRNLVLIGNGGGVGIDHGDSGELRVIGCLIRGFNNYGIHTAGGAISIDHSTLLDQAGGAGVAAPAFVGVTNPVLITITDSFFEGNYYAIFVETSCKVVVTHCTIDSSNVGITVHLLDPLGSKNAALVLERNTLAHSGAGVEVTTSGVTNTGRVVLSANVLAYNTTGVNKSGTGAVVDSFGNNRFVGNGADGGPFGAVALQ